MPKKKNTQKKKTTESAKKDKKVAGKTARLKRELKAAEVRVSEIESKMEISITQGMLTEIKDIQNHISQLKQRIEN